MSFAERMRAANRELILEAEGQVKTVALDLYGEVVARSPVDTGELKGSWTFRQIDGGYQIATDKPYAHVLEYGLYLNPPKGGKGKTVDGFSKQAPQGFVRTSILDIKNKYGR